MTPFAWYVIACHVLMAAYLAIIWRFTRRFGRAPRITIVGINGALWMVTYWTTLAVLRST